MFTSYMIVYMDKSILGQAAIYGLNQDLHLVGQDYSWCSSLFYFGFLIFQPVGAWILTYFPVGKFVAATSVFWAVILFITPAAQNFGGMAVMRVLLGIAEGGIAPAFVLITGTWYTQAEYGP
jgi:MFS family permease